MILSAGLTPDNVEDAIHVARPWGVDVNSGVEAAPGRKDPDKVRRFVRAARSAGDGPSEALRWVGARACPTGVATSARSGAATCPRP